MRKLAFISYRREDTSAVARGLYEQLRVRFGTSSIFMDVDTIAPGDHWPNRIRRALEDATVMLVLIGPGWLKAADEYGRRRLDQESDWVRKEVTSCLQKKIPIIPVLVADTDKVPNRQGLPNSLLDLSNRQGIRLKHDSWEEDFDKLCRKLVEDHNFIDSEKPVNLPPRKLKTSPLTEEQLNKALTILDGWEPVESTVPGEYPKSRQELRATFVFSSFKKAMEFMQVAVNLIEPTGGTPHHPRWENQWRTTTIWLTTWDIGNRISKLDIALAQKLNTLYAKFEE